jgi:hypothetical protein
VTKPSIAVQAVVGVFVGTEKVADVDRAKAETWPRLDSLLPEADRRYGTWNALGGNTASGPFEIKKPGGTYGALVPALFPDADGKNINLGLFDPVDLARKGPPKVSHVALAELHVIVDKSGSRGQNDHMGGEAMDPNKLTLSIEAGATKVELTGTQLIALPRENPPDDDSGEHQGWKLSSILAAAKVPMPHRILLTGEELNLTLEKADLDPKVSVPFVKLNRQGTLRFRTYKKQGDGWAVGGDLRGLRKIQVLQ